MSSSSKPDKILEPTENQKINAVIAAEEILREDKDDEIDLNNSKLKLHSSIDNQNYETSVRIGISAIFAQEEAANNQTNNFMNSTEYS